MEEIRELLMKTSEKTEAKFSKLQTAMSEIIAQNSEIKDSIAFMSNQYDELAGRVASIEKGRKDEQLYICHLEQKVETLERSLCSTKFELKNVPWKDNESKEDLCEIVTKSAQALDVPLLKQEIKDVFRTKSKKGTSAPIIVDLVSAVKREKLLKNVRIFNSKNNTNKLNTSHLGLNGPKTPIYVAESLTPTAQRVFYLARKFAKDHEYKYCWTSFGKVYLRLEEGKPYVAINSESDLSKLRSSL